MSNSAIMLEENKAFVEQEIDIEAPPEVVFEAIIEELNNIPGMDGKSMNLKLEPFPGGRLYRDLGNNTGHFWGHVQVIKPPTLLEICGPLMMSIPVMNHVAYRVTSNGKTSHLSLKHRAFGEIDAKFHGVKDGWWRFMESVKKNAQTKPK